MPNFLTVKEAAKSTGKSPSSIRRIIYPILEHDKHADRHHVEPSVKAAQTLRLKGENFAWKISEELLARVVASEGVKPKAAPKMNDIGDSGSERIVDILEKQLVIKDQQIAAQTDLIKSLSERLREGNILMGSLQQQLSPPDPAKLNKSDVVQPNVPSPQPEKASDARETSTKKPHWLFKKIF